MVCIQESNYNLSTVYSAGPCIHTVMWSVVTISENATLIFEESESLWLVNGFLFFFFHNCQLESHLEHLEVRFPREPLQTSLLIPVLKASRSLQSLSLDSATISCSQEVELLLHALKGITETGLYSCACQHCW